PDGFEGFRWGTSEESITSELAVRSSVDLSRLRPGLRGLEATVTIGGVSAVAKFYFQDDALERVILRFPYRDYLIVRRFVTERYGRPGYETATLSLWGGRQQTEILLSRSVPATPYASLTFFSAEYEAKAIEDGADSAPPDTTAT
ncbi:MAG: hypothetical protein ACREJ4_05395, partial [Candidatus Methylomirabilaceae bacterium]